MDSIELQLELNEACKLALLDNIKVQTWLEKYNVLYNRCSIKPPGRPSIALSFHDGIYFKEIDEFSTRYSNLIDREEKWTDEDYQHI